MPRGNFRESDDRFLNEQIARHERKEQREKEFGNAHVCCCLNDHKPFLMDLGDGPVGVIATNFGCQIHSSTVKPETEKGKRG
jgi:hypothetical protein